MPTGGLAYLPSVLALSTVPSTLLHFCTMEMALENQVRGTGFQTALKFQSIFLKKKDICRSNWGIPSFYKTLLLSSVPAYGVGSWTVPTTLLHFCTMKMTLEIRQRELGRLPRRSRRGQLCFQTSKNFSPFFSKKGFW